MKHMDALGRRPGGDGEHRAGEPGHGKRDGRRRQRRRAAWTAPGGRRVGPGACRGGLAAARGEALQPDAKVPRHGRAVAVAPTQAGHRRQSRDRHEPGESSQQRRDRAVRRGQRDAERAREPAGPQAAPRAGEELRRRAGHQRGDDRRLLDVLAAAEQVRQPGGAPVWRHDRRRRDARRRRDPGWHQGLREDAARDQAPA
jgi:hypothetical protein